MQASISTTANITANSGFTLIPRVSSSKNLSSPALAAGMGARLSLFFSLLLIVTITFWTSELYHKASVN